MRFTKEQIAKLHDIAFDIWVKNTEEQDMGSSDKIELCEELKPEHWEIELEKKLIEAGFDPAETVNTVDDLFCLYDYLDRD
jgi:hypothetical protein